MLWCVDKLIHFSIIDIYFKYASVSTLYRPSGLDMLEYCARAQYLIRIKFMSLRQCHTNVHTMHAGTQTHTFINNNINNLLRAYDFRDEC